MRAGTAIFSRNAGSVAAIQLCCVAWAWNWYHPALSGRYLQTIGRFELLRSDSFGSRALTLSSSVVASAVPIGTGTDTVRSAAFVSHSTLTNLRQSESVRVRAVALRQATVGRLIGISIHRCSDRGVGCEFQFEFSELDGKTNFRVVRHRICRFVAVVLG